ncbi:hypothetical protein [Natronosalvus amylolyticus]|uniref:hypothetical protein n=1 Tax=Natronosalvus amylolyticus TaxID=2961994 RepID=UPI0020C99902|nr:hypothetical protein [Natronosalvus amylolyticus]
MTARTNRVQKINEAKEIIAELEERKGLRLADPRGALLDAGNYIDSDRVYLEKIEKAMAQQRDMPSKLAMII